MTRHTCCIRARVAPSGRCRSRTAAVCRRSRSSARVRGAAPSMRRRIPVADPATASPTNTSACPPYESPQVDGSCGCPPAQVQQSDGSCLPLCNANSIPSPIGDTCTYCPPGQIGTSQGVCCAPNQATTNGFCRPADVPRDRPASSPDVARRAEQRDAPAATHVDLNLQNCGSYFSAVFARALAGRPRLPPMR